MTSNWWLMSVRQSITSATKQWQLTIGAEKPNIIKEMLSLGIVFIQANPGLRKAAAVACSYSQIVPSSMDCQSTRVFPVSACPSNSGEV